MHIVNDASDGNSLPDHEEASEEQQTYTLNESNPLGLRPASSAWIENIGRTPSLRCLMQAKKDLWFTNQTMKTSLQAYQARVDMQTRVVETDINARRRVTAATLKLSKTELDLVRTELEVAQTQLDLTRAQQELRLLQAAEEDELAAAERERRMKLLETNQVQSTRLAQATLGREEADAERRLRLAVRSASPMEARLMLGAELEVETLLAKIGRVRDQRRTGTFAPEPPMPVPPPETAAPEDAPPAVEVDVTAADIERIALRAFLCFSQSDPEEASALRQEWEEKLRQTYPSYACAEITRRLDELRGMAQS